MRLLRLVSSGERFGLRLHFFAAADREIVIVTAMARLGRPCVRFRVVVYWLTVE